MARSSLPWSLLRRAWLLKMLLRWHRRLVGLEWVERNRAWLGRASPGRASRERASCGRRLCLSRRRLVRLRLGLRRELEKSAWIFSRRLFLTMMDLRDGLQWCLPRFPRLNSQGRLSPRKTSIAPGKRFSHPGSFERSGHGTRCDATIRCASRTGS